MKIHFGDIFLVRFHPVIGSELKRYRPAIVVSEVVNKIDSRFTLIAPLTSNTKIYNKKYEIIVENDALDKTSALLLWYLKTVDVIRLERKLGKLDVNETVQIKKILNKVLC